MEYTSILFEKKENFAILTINRPDKLNSLNNTVFEEIRDVINFVSEDSSVKALIVTGSGEKAFAAGADITQLNVCDGTEGRKFSNFGSEIFLALENLQIPVIAAVNGFSLGGGCELALSCHIRFASENAKFGLPEANLGIIPGYGATQRLPKIVGRAKALELMLSANIIDANEAMRIGLVNQVYPANVLLEKTETFVKLILSKGPIAIKGIINSVMASSQMKFEDGLIYESMIFGEICGSEDFKEGTKAFLEKRKPNFVNK
jgi:enoyl-CoA hydratase